MSNSLTAIGRHLRQVTGAPEATLGDALLLDRFVTHRDEAAFAELVRRYGGLVLGVCRRIAGSADADDAFQATFLVLARKASGLLNQPTLGGWLYGVAHRAARKARLGATRRRARETAVAPRREGGTVDESPDALAVIEQELHALPRRYRKPLVLCALCGRARKAAAEELGIAEGTLSSRIAKARELLAERLRRRGVIVPAVAVLITSEAVGNAAVPSELADQAIKCANGTVPVAVGQLAAEVSRTMLLSKLRSVVLVAVGLVACAAGLVARGPNANTPAPTVPLADEKVVEKAGGLTAKDLRQKVEGAKKEFVGVWELQKQFADDKALDLQFEYYRYTFEERTLKIEFKHKVLDGGNRRAEEISAIIELNYTINPTTNPPQLTAFSKDALLMCIYEQNGDVLKVARHGISELERPRGFALKDKHIVDMPLVVWEFKRAAGAKKPEPKGER